MKTLILGGIKSGKSRLAEKLVKASNKTVFYLATSSNNDEEMEARVLAHQKHRPAYWTTIEEPIFLAETLIHYSEKNNAILVDCLTLWFTNLLMRNNMQLVKTESEKMMDSLSNLPGDVVFVSNETNLGIIPMGKLSRVFCDEIGLLHQKLAAQCDRVIFTVAGLPHVLKGEQLE